MEPFTLTRLENMFLAAAKNNIKYVGVLIHMDGFPCDEIIINENANIIPKLKYYKNTYDENLNHKFSKGIRIVSAACANDICTIEKFLKQASEMNKEV
jgi:hypothetical protein